MDLDQAKENIQPLSVGRNATLLHQALEHSGDLENQRKVFENAIANGESEDPLELWYKYLIWIEQSYPTDNKRDSGFLEVLIKCLFTFEKEPKYRQDQRLIKMMVKLIDESESPTEHYNRLYEEGIGTKVADFFVSWAFHFDVAGNIKRANAIYKKGIDAKAEPQEHLKEHYQHFLALANERMFMEDEDRVIEEIKQRRKALSTLSSIRNRVGSSRAGNPSNIRVIPNPDEDDSVEFGVVTSKGESIIQMIVDDMKKNENLVLPVSWNSGKSTKPMNVTEKGLGFEILDENDMDERPFNRPGKIRLPKNFVSRNLPQDICDEEFPLICEDKFPVSSVLMFPLTRLYPYPYTEEFSLEEYCAYKWYKIHKPELCKPRHKFWEDCFENGINLPFNFCDKNIRDPNDEVYETHGDLNLLKNLVLPYDLKEYYRDGEEFSEEEIRANKRHWTKYVPVKKSLDMSVDMELDSDTEENLYIPTKLALKKECIENDQDKFKENDIKRKFHQNFKENSREIYNQPGTSQSTNCSKLLKSKDSIESDQEEQSIHKKTSFTQSNKSDHERSNTSDCKSIKSILHASHPSETKDDLHVSFSNPIEESIPKVVKPQQKAVFDLDETSCSTMNFNNFIKMQSISTPIKTVPGEGSFEVESTHSSEEYAQRKLSTIQEAPDSFTYSTVSPSQKLRHQLTLQQTIPEGAPIKFFEEKTETIPNYLLKKASEERTETIPDFMLKKVEVPVVQEMSMLAPEKTETINFTTKKNGPLFEDKTETIPNFLLKKESTQPIPDCLLKKEIPIVAEMSMMAPEKTETIPFISKKNSPPLFEETTETLPKFMQKKIRPEVSFDYDEFLEIPKKATKSSPNSLSGFQESIVFEQKPRNISKKKSLDLDEFLLTPTKNPNPPSTSRRSEDLESTKELLNIEFERKAPTDCTEYMGNSIYVQKTPTTMNRHEWNDDDLAEENVEETIRTVCYKENVNPFSCDLIEKFLLEFNFYEYIETLPYYEYLEKSGKLRSGIIVRNHDVSFEVIKPIGEGAFGTVFLAKNLKTGEKVAMKQEKPQNYWELYILLELSYRIFNENLKSSYMKADYAMSGRNSSIIVYNYSPYGDLLQFLKKYQKVTSRNLDEYLVMHLTSQLLTIIDTLHAAEIIHADLKPDNILIRDILTYDKTVPSIQLIDFGVSIDMSLFPNKSFDFCHNLLQFKCIEMRENRRWTYQLDLFGIAGIIHVMLFGMYMEVQKTEYGWKPIKKLPRYYQREVWDNIFHTLLNVKDCKSMPNLQNLRESLEEILVEKESLVRMKINEANNCLCSK